MPNGGHGSGHEGVLLLIHDDTELLDLLTQVLEHRGFRVHVAATAARARSELGARDYDVVVTDWDVAQGDGAELYEWALARRFHLRGRFVFLAHEVPEQFQDVVQGRCLVIDPHAVDELVRVVEAAVHRARQVADSRLSLIELEWVSDDQPTMLLVDDDPAELMVMLGAFSEFGFAVTPAESGNAAIAQLEADDFAVIVSDWFMTDGSGADLYDWIHENRSYLLSRLVFLSDTTPKDVADRAPGRSCIPKGQDSPQLIQTIVAIARRGRR